MLRQQATPEAETESGAADDTTQRSPSPETSAKGMQDVEDALKKDGPLSPPEEPKDNEARLSQSMYSTEISPSYPMEYLSYPSDGDERVREPRESGIPAKTYANVHFQLLPNSTSSFLRPGSKFRGTQQSDRQVYDVQVEIKHVDMADSFLCGYLRIQGNYTLIYLPASKPPY